MIILFFKNRYYPWKRDSIGAFVANALVHQIINTDNGENGKGDAIAPSDSIAAIKKT